MNILFLDWPCYGKNDTILALTQLGHNVFLFFHKDYQERKSSDFSVAFYDFVSEQHIDLCFSFNYYPVLSEAAKEINLKYISIIYDSPYVMLYSYTLINYNNYVFLFDSHEYINLKSAGIPTVYYLPLAVNSCKLTLDPQNSSRKNDFNASVSFVGSLYNQSNSLFSRLKGLSAYTKEYLDGIINVQLKVSGYNFI